MKKSVSALCIASLLSVGGFGVASAAPHYAFAPPGTYTFSGPTTLVKSPLTLSCTSTFTVTVPTTTHSPAQPPAHGDTATVTAASFSGSNPLCSSVVAASLPWTVTPNSLTSVTVAGVAVNTLIGNCGPSSLTGSWTNGPPAAMSFTSQPLSGGCSVTGVLTATTSTGGIILVP